MIFLSDGGLYVCCAPAHAREDIIPAGVQTALQLLFDVCTSDLDKVNKDKSGKAAAGLADNTAT